MSNVQRPGNGSNSPWASQDPNWRPQQFHDAAQRDPRTPFGQQPPAPPSEEELAPPRNRRTLWLVVAVVGLIAVVILAMQFLGGDSSAPVASASPSTRAAEPTATRTGNYIPFEGNGGGIFEISHYEWSGDELHLRIKVEVDEGEGSFALFAFTNETRDSYDPVDPSSFTASADSPYVGDVVFVMPNADSTIVLTTPSGRVALNALPVKAG